MAPPGLLDPIIETVGYGTHDSHKYIEIFGTNNSEVKYNTETLHDKDIQNLCARPIPRPDGQWSLRLLIEIAGRSRDGGIPYSEESYAALQKYWHVPRIGFFHAIRNTAWNFTPVYGDSDWQGLRLCLDFPLGWKLILSHHAPSRTTLAILNGDNTAGFQKLITELMAMKTYAYQPQLLPFLVIRSHVRSGLHLEDAIWKDYAAIKSNLRCSEYVVTAGRPARADREELDMTDMPRKLTALLDELALSTSAIASQAAIIKHVDGLLGRYEGEEGQQVVAEMRAQLCSMQHFCEDLRQTQSARKETVQAMVQMVYATLQQRDNEIAHRYGADMRIITVIALLFLPGTFVAQVFSAPFWHFSPDGSEPWVWVYWGVTVSLTALVLGAWRGIIVLERGRQEKGVEQGWRRAWRLWWGRGRGRERGDEDRGRGELEMGSL